MNGSGIGSQVIEHLVSTRSLGAGGTVSSWLTAQFGEAKNVMLAAVAVLALVGMIVAWVKSRGALAPVIVAAAGAACFIWLANNIDSPTIKDKVNNQMDIGAAVPFGLHRSGIDLP